MIKNLLIHTDFSIRSLGLLKTALNEHSDQKVNIILGYGYRLSSSISDLLFLSNRKLIESLTSTEFKEALQVLQSKYSSQINELRIEPFTGVNQLAFENYISGNAIDEAYLYVGYESTFRGISGFDIAPMIRKLNAVHKIPFEGATSTAQHHETLADLFFSKIPGFNR